jgi:hypothetical protein
MTELTDRHRRLARAVGRWEGGEESVVPDAKGAVRAFSETRMVAGGRIRVTEHRHEMAGEVVLEGHSVTVWDPVRSACVMYWFDAGGGPPVEYAGDFDGDLLILEGPGPEGTRIRHVTDLPDADTMRTRSYLSRDGVAWDQVFTGRYHRVASG